MLKSADRDSTLIIIILGIVILGTLGGAVYIGVFDASLAETVCHMAIPALTGALGIMYGKSIANGNGNHNEHNTSDSNTTHTIPDSNNTMGGLDDVQSDIYGRNTTTNDNSIRRNNSDNGLDTSWKDNKFE